MKNSKHILICTLLLLGSWMYGSAQEIKGLVFDLQSSQRLSDVLIENLQNKKSVRSNADGSFTIPGQKMITWCCTPKATSETPLSYTRTACHEST